jgi:tetratricopeptide (TPR) repeat protein
MRTTKQKSRPQRRRLPKGVIAWYVLGLTGLLVFLVATGYVEPTPGSAAKCTTAASESLLLNLNEMQIGELINRGNKAMDQSQYFTATNYYSAALARDSGLADVRSDRGACLHALGQYDNALADFELVLQQDSGHATAMLNSGIVLYSMGRYAEAEKRWKEYERVAPGGTGRATIQRLRTDLLNRVGGK